MSKVDIKKSDGAKSGTVELDEDIFGIEPNVAVMHQVVNAQLATKRSGTHSTKTRAEVRGGGAKPWKQRNRTGKSWFFSNSTLARGRNSIGPKSQRLLTTNAKK